MDMKLEEKIENTITELLSGEKIPKEELENLDIWLQKEENRRKFHQMQRLHAAVYANQIASKISTERGWAKIAHTLKPQRKLGHLFIYAAGIILLISTGLVLSTLKQNQEASESPQANITHFNPAKQVTLTLSDGREIPLSDSLSPLQEANGTIIRHQGIQLVYSPQDSSPILLYNTVKVPRGGEYVLTLSDGSTIWINSESEITYPVTFSHHERAIQLKGEAFFNIRKDSLRPFLVHTQQFDIRVTGTEFNVRTYPDDMASATLTQGKIQLEKNSKITRLTAGEQALMIDDQIQIKTVDPEEAVAWRYGVFCFKQRRLESLLSEVARWYDLEVFYQHEEIKNYHFTAWFRRSDPLEQLIETLEKTEQVKLELKEKTLMVGKLKS